MALKTAAELRAEAEALVAATVQHQPVKPVDRAAMVDAVTFDLGVADDQAVIAEDRLLKIEAQTRILSETVVAITDAAAAIAPAAKALKDEM